MSFFNRILYHTSLNTKIHILLISVLVFFLLIVFAGIYFNYQTKIRAQSSEIFSDKETNRIHEIDENVYSAHNYALSFFRSRSIDYVFRFEDTVVSIIDKVENLASNPLHDNAKKNLLASLDTYSSILFELYGESLVFNTPTIILYYDDQVLFKGLSDYCNNALTLLIQTNDMQALILFQEIREQEKLFLRFTDSIHSLSFSHKVEKLVNHLRNLAIASEDKNKLEATIGKYSDEFNRIKTDLFNFKIYYVAYNNAFLDVVLALQELLKKHKQVITKHVSQQNRTILLSTMFAFIGTTLLLLFTTFFSFLLLRNILLPIKALGKYAGAITPDQYDGDLTLYGSDEIGRLAKHLHGMKESLRKHHAELELKIESRTTKARRSNASLEKTIVSLESARED